MTPEEFRTAGHELVDWIADFRSGLPDLPVQAAVAPGEVRAGFPMSPPSAPGPFADLLTQLDDVVVPGMTHVQHPRFFGFFPCNASLTSALADLASTGLGGLGISWEACPSLTEVEEVMCDWMRQLTGLSDGWTGTIQDTASTACLVALLCARERASGHSQARGGLQGEEQPLVVYASAEAHSSVVKAALLAGYGRDNLRIVATDRATGAMRIDALAYEMAADVKAGRKPAAVVASIGSTATTAFDPLEPLVMVAKIHDAWVHVDAAMAGAALLLPERRSSFDGLEGADSFTWNPHKWIGAALDCSLYYVRDPEHLVRVMSTDPSYLRSTADGAVTQFRDWGIPLGRRFRALKLWFLLHLDGIESIQARLRRDLDNAQWLAVEIAATPDWQVVKPVPLQTVCVRHEPPGLEGDALDDHTRAWVRRVNGSGAAYLTPAMVDGRWLARVSIGAERTERDDIEAAWAAMQEAADAAAHQAAG